MKMNCLHNMNIIFFKISVALMLFCIDVIYGYEYKFEVVALDTSNNPISDFHQLHFYEVFFLNILAGLGQYRLFYKN